MIETETRSLDGGIRTDAGLYGTTLSLSLGFAPHPSRDVPTLTVENVEEEKKRTSASYVIALMTKD